MKVPKWVIVYRHGTEQKYNLPEVIENYTKELTWLLKKGVYSRDAINSINNLLKFLRALKTYFGNETVGEYFISKFFGEKIKEIKIYGKTHIMYRNDITVVTACQTYTGEVIEAIIGKIVLRNGRKFNIVLRDWNIPEYERKVSICIDRA